MSLFIICDLRDQHGGSVCVLVCYTDQKMAGIIAVDGCFLGISCRAPSFKGSFQAAPVNRVIFKCQPGSTFAILIETFFCQQHSGSVKNLDRLLYLLTFLAKESPCFGNLFWPLSFVRCFFI